MMVTFDDILQAQKRIRKQVRHTPLLSSPLLSQKLGRDIYVKAENLQITGSFKFRGACNRIAQLTEQELPSGVVAYSSGNHAQGVAAAARMRGCSADIVMPADTPAIKVERTKNWGGQVHFYDRASEDRQAIAEEIANKKGAVLIPPFDDSHVIAGQGTAGCEIMQDCEALGVAPSAVLVPCGGGGLAAGVATVMKHAYPDCHVYVGEPPGFDSTTRSLQAGKIIKGEAKGGVQLCDALLTPSPGELTFAINSRLLQGGFVMQDAAVKEAIVTAFSHFKLVVEGGGAIGLAALLQHHKTLPAGAVVVVLSGGNIDASLFQKILTESL